MGGRKLNNLEIEPMNYIRLFWNNLRLLGDYIRAFAAFYSLATTMLRRRYAWRHVSCIKFGENSETSARDKRA